MKNRFLFSVIIIVIMTVYSGKAQIRIGPGIGFITETRTLLLSAHANYDLPGNLGVMASYDYIFAQTSSHKWWGLDLDGTYTFVRPDKKGKLYALAGFNLLHQSFSGNNNSYAGLNLGVGWRFKLGDKLEWVPEAKITLGKLSYLRLGINIMYNL
ncbi:MAG: hypothetical protein WCP08_11725 [Prolixibacteraceae bacterium]